jgi:hypothetical protein
MKTANLYYGYRRMFFLFILVFFINQHNYAIHPDLDTQDVWIQINDGFARCAPIGQSAGQAWWAQDGWSFSQWVHKRGIMYAWIGYDNDNNPTNSASCRTGLFRHDTLTNKWVRVAHYPEYLGGYYKNMDLLSNGDDIFCVYSGSVWRLVEPSDPVNYPIGWELISVEPHRILTSGDVFGYSNLDCMAGGFGRENQTGIFGNSNMAVIEAIVST